MSECTKPYMRKTAALLLALSLLCAALTGTMAEGVSNVQVRAAVLDSDTVTADGMVRVYLASLGSPTVLNLRIGGGYSLGSTGEYLADGTAVTVNFNTATGAISLSFGGRTLDMGRHVTLRRYSASSSHGITISQSKDSANPYPGDLELRAVYGSSGYQLYTIVHVYIENYLYGVLPYEMGNSSSIEALKAQAVAARTYTVRMMKSRSSGMYDVKDTTSDQTYRGTPSGNANCVAAIDATKGIVLMYGSSYITTYYSASNGGQTETSRTGGSYAYMPVKDDPFDYANPSSTVKRKTIYANLQSASNNAQLISLLKTKAIAKLSQSGYYATQSNTTLGTLLSMTPHSPKYASPSRLYTKMDFRFTAAVNGSSTTVTVTCDIFGELESILSLGIQSTANELWSVSSGSNSFEIQVRRYGHGMGMSQRGAMYMARLGYTYDQILGFYYEGCTRVKHSFTHTFLAPSGDEQVNVEKPAEDEMQNQSACYGIVRLVSTGASLAIRNAKSSGAAVIGSAPNGAKLDVLYSDGSWCLIRFGELRGYVPASSLSLVGSPVEGDIGPSSIMGFARVTASDYVNLRAGESKGAQVLGSAPAGAVLTVFSRNGSWAKIQYNALTAYVNINYISAVTQTYPDDNLSSGTSIAIVRTSDGGSVNLRATASTSAQILASLPSGTQVTVLSDDGAWSCVSANGMTGYVMSDYLYDPNAAEQEPPQEEVLPEGTVRAVVTTQSGSLNMRSLPQVGSQILAVIPRNTEIDVTGRGDAWSSVYYNGLNGYVMTSYLTFVGEEPPSPSTPSAGEKAIVVTPGGSLNLRAYPQAGSEILFWIPQGAEVAVHEYGNEWCHVTYQGITGYVMTVFLSFEPVVPEKPEPEVGTDTAVRALVNTQIGGLNLRTQPSTAAGVITVIPQYAQLDVIQHGQQWCMVSWQGTTGYVMTSYLTIITDPTDPPEIEVPPTVPEVQKAYVSTASGSLNLRSEPSSAAQILYAIPRNAAVDILAYGDAWCAVRYGVETGYVMTRFLSFDEPSDNENTVSPDQTEKTVWVNTASGALNLRSQPSADAQILTMVPQFARLTSYGGDGTWTYVSYQGVYGYVMTRYLAEGNPPQNTDNGIDESLIVNGMDITMRVPASATYATAVEGQGLALWESCDESGQAMAFVPPYQQIEIILMGEIWCCVDYQGVQGYCRTELLSVI